MSEQVNKRGTKTARLRVSVNYPGDANRAFSIDVPCSPVAAEGFWRDVLKLADRFQRQPEVWAAKATADLDAKEANR